LYLNYKKEKIKIKLGNDNAGKKKHTKNMLIERSAAISRTD